MSGVRSIEWRRLGIEATAIVVSILLAFWIDAWWEDRNEKASYLAQLRAFEQELVENAETLDQHVQMIFGYVSAIDRVLQHVGSAEAISDSVYKDIGAGLNFLSDPISTSVYNEILNSGTLQKIQSSELRAAIGDYDRMIDRLSDTTSENWSAYRSVMVPFLVNHVPLDELGWQRDHELNIDGRAAIATNAPTFPPSMKLLDLQSPTAWNTLYYWRVMQQDNADARIDVRQSIYSILQHLQAEVE